MKIKIQIAQFLVFLAFTQLLGISPLEAGDLEDLARQSYAVIAETRVDGDFEGCDFDKRIPLLNGIVFVCKTYSYSYSYMPEVFILKHVSAGDIKVVIDNHEYDGQLYRGR